MYRQRSTHEFMTCIQTMRLVFLRSRFVNAVSTLASSITARKDFVCRFNAREAGGTGICRAYPAAS
jgi:hypothetical protein